jgi:DNA-binding response OmpR family regulator
MPPKRILCVEPSPDICELVQHLLRGKGYEIDSASTIEEAERKARSGSYSLYIIDDGYPNGTNAELAAALRALSPVTPIIVFTAHAFERDRQEALAYGAAAFLTKPEGVAQLPEVVSRLLASAPI